ncbi:MAG: NPCBM/NEW2 domain-containing protein [Pirellulaceae bacterium]|nr:NPCBM/NEW2 domain-containing protein [Pirellulaceae bacterium]
MNLTVFRYRNFGLASARVSLRSLVLVGAVLASLPAGPRPGAAQTTSPPRFSARSEVTRMRERAMQIEAEIAGASQLFLVVLGAHWGWANWAEPRLVGPEGELRLTDLRWKFASAGYGQPRVNANVRGDPLRINGAPVPYGIGVHDPSLIIYDLPPGYTHFRARGGLDDAGAGPVTFQVYAGHPFFDPANPRLWQRDTRRQVSGEAMACVEFFGGDRLPGRVVGAGTLDAFATPAAAPTLVVKPLAEWNPPNQSERDSVQVLQQFVRRIVWEPAPRDYPACEPGSVRFRDGSRVRFRSVRFDDGAVKLLTPDGLLTATWAELAEIHLPERDPWDAYYEELAVLSPGLTDVLVHLETDQGLIATASLERSHCLPPWHHDAEPQVWHLGVQPAWSADVLWLNETSLVARRQFAPERVPLSCRNVTVPAVVGTASEFGWSPQTNRNVQAQPLITGGRTHSWGFGVHAPNRLAFQLPALADAFRTQAGLDHLAGDGGCALARVLFDAGSPRTLWQSPIMIGSAQVFDSGRLPLPTGSGDTARLVLEVDAAHQQRPAGADPFTIRDTVDWLDPELELNRDRLLIESDRKLDGWIPAFQGWQVTADDGAPPRLVSYWTSGRTRPAQCRLAISTGLRPLTMTRRVELGRQSHLRIVALRPPGDETFEAELEVFIDDQSRYRGPVPMRRGPSRDSSEILVPLPAAEAESATLKIIQRPADAKTLVEWHILETIEIAPP